MPTEVKDILSPLADLCSAIWLDDIKDHVKQKTDKKKLKNDILSFMETQKQYHTLSGAIDSEFDFEGLLNYFQTDLLKDCKQRFFNPDKKKRHQANEEILSKAVEWSDSRYPESTDRVKSITNNILIIIGNFYKRDIKPKDYYLAAEIVDAELDGTQDIVCQEADRIIERLDRMAIYPRLAVDGNPSQQDLDDYLKFASVKHKLFPYYGVTIDNGQFRSIPLTKEASEKYPVNYKITGTVTDGERYFNDADVNPLEYATNHQVCLYVNVKSIEKYLGNEYDPNQGDIDKLVGSQIIIEPGKLSEQVPVALRLTELNKADGKFVTNTYYNKLLFQIEEKLEDGTVIIGNKAQDDSPICIEIKCYGKEEQEASEASDFQIHLKQNCTHHDILTFARLIRVVNNGSNLIHIYNLEANKDLMFGRIEPSKDKSNYKNLDNDIRFLEDVCKVEDYFGVGLNINGKISTDDLGIIDYLARLIEGQYVYEWKSLECEGIVDDSLRSGWSTMINDDYAIDPFVFCCHRTVDVEIFDAKISFEEQVTYDNAYLDDIVRVRKKIEVLEDGDPIKIKFVAGNGKAIVTEKIV